MAASGIPRATARRIQVLVEENMKGNQTNPRDVVELEKLMANTQTRDAVYDALTRKFTLQGMKKHPPSVEMVRQLRVFWSGYASDTTAVGKSAVHILAIADDLLSRTSRETEANGHTGGPPVVPGNRPPMPNPKNGSAAVGTASVPPSLPPKSVLSPVVTVGLAPITPFHAGPSSRQTVAHRRSGDDVLMNFTAIRGAAGLVPQQLNVSLVSNMTYGGQFRRVSGTLSFDKRDAVPMPNVGSASRSIRVIGLEKKRDELSEYHKSGKMKSKSVSLKLLNYKDYREQLKLNLSKEEMKEVFDTVVNRHRDEDYYRTCCKTAIKLFFDIYVADGKDGFIQTVSIFLEMLSSTKNETRVGAFDLLFNLSIHANLFEANHGGMVEEIQDVLYEYFCCPMLLAVFQSREKDVRVWSSGMNVLLYFLAGDRVSRKKVQMLNPRIIVGFLERLEVDDNTRRFLLRCLVNSLYHVDPETNELALNVPLLHRTCGLDFILESLMLSRSMEERNNLFSVLFDYVVDRLSHIERWKPTTENPESIQIISEVMKQFELPHVLPQIIRHLPPRFVENFVNFVVSDQLASVSPTLAQRIEKDLLIQILTEFEQLIILHWKLESEFEAKFVALSSSKSNIVNEMEEISKMLDLLLHSDSDVDRRNGQVFVFELMISAIDQKPIWEPQKLRHFVNRTCLKLLHSGSPVVRRAFYSITGRLIQLYKMRGEKLASEKLLQNIFQLLNTQFKRITEIPERDEQNLLMIADLIFELISIPPLQTSPTDPYEPLSPDFNYELLLSGKSLLSYSLLQRIDVQILLHLFSQLNAIRHAYVRLTLLLFVMEKCRHSDGILKSPEGRKLFTVFLNDKSPEIAYFSSRFLLTHLSVQVPEMNDKYVKLLHQQTTREKSALDNPYAQIKVLLRVLQDFS